MISSTRISWRYVSFSSVISCQSASLKSLVVSQYEFSSSSSGFVHRPDPQVFLVPLVPLPVFLDSLQDLLVPHPAACGRAAANAVSKQLLDLLHQCLVEIPLALPAIDDLARLLDIGVAARVLRDRRLHDRKHFLCHQVVPVGGAIAAVACLELRLPQTGG
ncbi:hypothetical protein DL89DRAFT_16425 [Linderina pennispora]|uniref:Uncharacterized protein n=1 Tax=Linderina pennispora TaxID=61395 RepID=A0A1Y1WLK5_9FUNG|nr:uncharacterized protein DL89DRAFT_16425 [Linderina pennispora]ORX74437.1 hypothetical protein DL89DRAFT_16425 [Linderina pennispora]